MIKKLKRLLGINIVEWVDNTEKKYEWLEAKKFLQVESATEGQLLFTPSQVKIAKACAQRNQEDIQMKNDFSDSTLFRQLSLESEEIRKLKWIESEKANIDIGLNRAIILWVTKHRSKWLLDNNYKD